MKTFNTNRLKTLCNGNHQDVLEHIEKLEAMLMVTVPFTDEIAYFGCCDISKHILDKLGINRH